ncbi:MFS family permease [Deinococcus metalli]|uniref:MFS family permease n=1 Tax=Deinococcus metalli TaxID=1141878 RepID=A0A7W8NPJ6_9DEIO|nr:MFS transporter [Deinococcus metalli]MBB5376836.1 MFS family permease [Deinococcus metalli]GHF45721.1 MFS transporter [Deinococcus metalli]
MTTPRSDSAPADGWRTFLWLWSSQAISVLGSAVAGFAFTIYLTQTRFPLAAQKPQLAAALSLTALAWTLAATVTAPLAGTWTDRHDRRRIMLMCDVLGAGLTLLLMALLLRADTPLWVLVLTSGLMGVVSTFHGSAFDASYTSLVPRARLPRANGLMQTIWSASGLVGPAAAALLIGVPAVLRDHGGPPWIAGLRDGVPFAYAVDGASFLLAALVLSRLHVPSPARPADTGDRSFRQDMTFGWRFIGARRPLLALLLTFAVANLCGSGLGVLEPLLVKFSLADDWTARGSSFQAALATLGIVQSVGGVLGGVIISTWGGLRRVRVLGVLVPMVVSGVALIALGLSGTVLAASLALFVSGVMLPAMNAHSQSIWQSQVPTHMQGRVFSVRRLIAQFTTPASAALAGLLAAQYPPGGVLVAAGALYAAVAALQLLNPSLRPLGDAPAPTS